MKKWTVGDLQAMRAASRFTLGLGVLAILLSVLLLIVWLKSTPEPKSSDPDNHDALIMSIIVVVGVTFTGAGGKLRSYLKNYERESGLSSKPFGWMP